MDETKEEAINDNTHRWSCLLKAFVHNWQTYFRSSLCVNLCFVRALELLNILPQVRQGIVPDLPAYPFTFILPTLLFTTGIAGVLAVLSAAVWFIPAMVFAFTTFTLPKIKYVNLHQQWNTNGKTRAKGKDVANTNLQKEFGLGGKVVVTLIEELLGNHYMIFFDNYFSSLPLLEYLKAENTLVVTQSVPIVKDFHNSLVRNHWIGAISIIEYCNNIYHFINGKIAKLCISFQIFMEPENFRQ